MSRLPFWLPPGSDVPRSIPKLIVKGFNGPPEARQALVANLSGAIKQFYFKASHNHSLGIVDISASTRETPNYKLTYANLGGQEFVTIEVATLVAVTEDQGVSIPWDWAVVDFHIALFKHTYNDGDTFSGISTLFAKLVFPEPQVEGVKANPSAEWGAASWNIDEYDSAEEKPIVQWGYSSRASQIGTTETVTEEVEIPSLLVDLRRWPMYEQISIEIYGGVESPGDDFRYVPGERAAYWVTQRLSVPDDLEDPDHAGVPTPATLTHSTGEVLPVGTPSPYADYADNSAVPTDYPQHGGGEYPDGEVPDPPFSPVWGEYIAESEVIDVTIPQGRSYLIDTALFDGVIGWDFHENILHYDFYPTYFLETETVPVVPSTTATLRGAMFRGAPDWAWSEKVIQDMFVYYAPWEIVTHYPERFGTGILKDNVPIAGAEVIDTVENNYGMPLIGTLHFSPKSGGMHFEPA